MGNHKAFTILSNPNELRAIRKEVENFAEQNGFSVEQAGQIGLAVNEAIANVIEHSYMGDTNKKIDITLDMCEFDGENALKIIIRDYGRHVSPECIKSRELNDVRPGGLGVHIIKTVMDNVEYKCIPEGGMQLIMIKMLRLNEDTNNES